MSDSIPTPLQLEEVLKQLLHPDTEIVRNAGNIISKILRKGASMMVFLELIHKSAFPELRQLAGVLMRKKIVGHWGKLNAQDQESVKKVLLDSLVKDQSFLVRKSSASVISAIAKLLLPAGQWNELLEFLFQCSKSPQVEHREVAMNLFNSLTETVGDYLRPHFAVLHNIFMAGLQDPDHRVRIASLKAVGSLVGWLTTDNEVILFRQLIPLMLETIRFCLTQGFEDDAIAAFEVFDDLAEMPIPIIATLIPDIVKFVLEIGANKQFDNSVRQQALTFVEWVISFKPKSLVKAGLIGPILQVIFPLCAEPDSQHDDEDTISNHKFASQIVDQMALRIATKHIYAPAMEYVKHYSGSANPTERRAAVIALAVLAEGCAVTMRQAETLPVLLSVVYRGFKDSDQGVREASCIALGQFSKHLQPEIIQHYQNVLPFLFESLADPTEKVRMGSLYAIEAFCENLDEEIVPFLEPLMLRLVELLQRGNTQMQEIAISAISSTAVASKRAFLPYYGPVINMMRQLNNINTEKEIMLRCRAIECAGLIGVAVGREVFQPALQEFMNLALEGLQLGFSELKEYTYGFFCSVAEILKENFAPYLPTLVPILLASCDSTEGITGVKDDDEDAIHGIEDDEDDEDDGALNIHIRTGFLDEKSTACHALGVFAEQTKKHFMPFVDPVVKSFNNLTNYFHEEVRMAVMISFRQLMVAMNDAFPPAQPWTKGLSQPALLNANSKQFADIIYSIFLENVREDEDKEAVSNTFDQLAEMVKLMGPASIEAYLPEVMTNVIKILDKKSVCQMSYEDDGEDEEDELLEMQLIESTCDSLSEICKICGGLIQPFFQAVLPGVIKYQAKSNSPEYRSLAIATLSDLCNAGGAAIIPFWQKLFDIAVKGTSDKDPEVRSNSSFFLGILMQHAGLMSLDSYPKALAALAPLFQDKDDLPNIKDNACAAVARMIMVDPSRVPLNQVLPVILDNLPLKADFDENKTVYGALFYLFKISHESVVPNIGKIISVFSSSLGSPNIAQDLQAEMVSILKTLNQQYSSQMQQFIRSLPENLQKNLQQYLS